MVFCPSYQYLNEIGEILGRRQEEHVLDFTWIAQKNRMTEEEREDFLKQERLRDYFAEQGGCGFDYAYQYPGMNKVMQAAGRVIRTIRDKGVIALLDDRFLNPQCVSLFPREWGTYTVVNRYNVGQAVNAFWDRTDQACSTAGYP